nr:2-amino-4-hydroxy-6-hydroxymethyldihydropteridine diphosphokinase [Parachlamydiaceae bacterium]
MEHKVYLGLGGNIGDSLSILQSALQSIQKLDIQDFKVSSFYSTQPVSDIVQRWYVNAACRFRTTMGVKDLLHKLQQIEIEHGKIVKPKNAPRTIDIDVLFFGNERHDEAECEIPHPRWRERLFVIKP